MVITFQCVNLALKKLGQVNGTIEKLDYIQIFFILCNAIHDAQLQNIVQCLDIGLATAIAYQVKAPGHLSGQRNPMRINSVQSPLETGVLLLEMKGPWRGTDLCKWDLHRIS